MLAVPGWLRQPQRCRTPMPVASALKNTARARLRLQQVGARRRATP